MYDCFFTWYQCSSTQFQSNSGACANKTKMTLLVNHQVLRCLHKVIPSMQYMSTCINMYIYFVSDSTKIIRYNLLSAFWQFGTILRSRLWHYSKVVSSTHYWVCDFNQTSMQYVEQQHYARSTLFYVLPTASNISQELFVVPSLLPVNTEVESLNVDSSSIKIEVPRNGRTHRLHRLQMCKYITTQQGQYMY